MGRYSSDSDDDYNRSRKKKKRRSRSASYSSDDSRKRSRRSKKSKKKSSRRRSRSRSSERSSRRRRSPSRERRRRSRSRSRTRRSRSPYSRSRRSRSRRRSRSTSRKRSRSRSRNRTQKNRSRSRSTDSRVIKAALENVDPCLSIPGFADMSQTEKNEVRMKMAIKAAAATDAKLREQGVLSDGQGIRSESLVYDKQQERNRRIQDIESGAFVQQTFTSAKDQVEEQSMDQGHESAIFSASSSLEQLSKNIVYKNTGSLLGPIFYESADAKWDRWIEKVKEFRRKRLEGEAIS